MIPENGESARQSAPQAAYLQTIRPDSTGLGLAEVLEDLVAFVCRFVVMSDAQAAVLALWVCHSYAVGAAGAAAPEASA